MNESTSLKEWTWIGDVLFIRSNRSVNAHLRWVSTLKCYFKVPHFSDLLILRELADWNDIKPRLVRNSVPIIVFCLAIMFNFVLMLMSFKKKRRSFHYK